MKFLLFIVLASSIPLSLAQSLDTLLWEKLGQRIAAYDRQMEGVLGVAIIDLQSGYRWSYHGDTVFAQASLIKVPILIEIFRLVEAGQLRLEEKVTLQPGELVGGSGVLQKRLAKGPLQTNVEEIVREMIASSDNTATNWCIRRLGMANVNQTMRRLGFPETKLQRVMLDQTAASRNEENVSTPNEMATMLERIHRGQVLSPPSCQAMLAYLKLVKADMREAIPPEIPVAAKPGEVSGVRTETGIVYLEGRPFVLSIMGSFLTEPQNPIGELTKLVLAHMRKLQQGNRYGNLGVR